MGSTSRSAGSPLASLGCSGCWGARTVPWEPALAGRLRAAHGADALELARLNRAVGEAFAVAAEGLAGDLGLSLDLVGSHGQTVAHDHRLTTLQIGEAAVLAERLGCPVISDFRQNDIAAGGCGAPLVPIVDRWLLSRSGAAVLALNIGGITNLTALPPREAAHEALIGFDCGPGNMVLDELARRRSGGAEGCDRDGALAAGGTVDAGLLAELLATRRWPRLRRARWAASSTAPRSASPARSPRDTVRAGWRDLSPPSPSSPSRPWRRPIAAMSCRPAPCP